MKNVPRELAHFRSKQVDFNSQNWQTIKEFLTTRLPNVSYLHGILPMFYFRFLFALLVCAVGLLGCVSKVTPLELGTKLASFSEPDDIAFLGLTVTMESATYRGNATIDLFVQNEALQKDFRLVLNAGQFGSSPKPALFRLPSGRYRFLKANLHAPGRVFGEQKFSPFDVALAIGKDLPLLELPAGTFLHFGTLNAKISASLVGNTDPRLSYSHEFVNALPSHSLWSSVLIGLNARPVQYLRSKGTGKEIVKWQWEKLAREKPNASANTAEETDQIRSKELDSQLTGTGFDVRRCMLEHARNFKGEVRIAVLFQPEGNVEKYSFENAELLANKNVEKCVKNTIEALKLSPREDGRSNTWTLRFEIK